MQDKERTEQLYRQLRNRSILQAGLIVGIPLALTVIAWIIHVLAGLVGVLITLMAGAFAARRLVDSHRQLAAWKKKQDDRMEDEAFRGFRLR